MFVAELSQASFINAISKNQVLTIPTSNGREIRSTVDSSFKNKDFKV